MNLLQAVMQPLSLDDLKTHYDEGRCLVLEGSADKFIGLVAPKDIERRINDGANISQMPQVIRDGNRSGYVVSDCAWAGAALDKSRFNQDITDGMSFMISNCSQLTSALAGLTTELEDFFAEDKVHADVHVYVSTTAGGNSYNAHRDRPQHNLLLQAYGSTDWQNFKTLEDLPDDLTAITPEQQSSHLDLASEFTLKQGDLLYMPPGVFHRVVGVGGPRISLSIPFFAIPQAARMDRGFIALTRLFNQ